MVEDTFVRITEFNSSRALLITLIDFLALSERDPERWPALETVLHRALADERQRVWKNTDDALDFAWGIIANVSSGDWTKQTPEWQEAATKWRDAYWVAWCRQRGGE